MALIRFPTYATAGSAPKASCIGWIDWMDFSLDPNTTESIEVKLPNDITMTFDIENINIIGEPITFISNTTLTNSAFGTLGYTGITEKIALESFSSYFPTIYDSAKLKISNISVKNNLGNPISGYSIILASIQLDDELIISDFLPDSQTFFTNGTDWNQIVWLGNTSSPVVDNSDKKNIIINTISNTSGSPVYSTNAPSNVSITISSDTNIPQFAIGVAISSITLQKIVNGRFTSNDQFTLSITGPVSDSVDTEGTDYGLQSKFITLNGPVNNLYTINETMAPGSDSTLDKFTQLITWINNCADGNPPPTTGYLGQEILVDIGDNFVATISNSPITTPSKADPSSGPEAELITWTQFHNLVMVQNTSCFVSLPLSLPSSTPFILQSLSASPLALEFIITNSSNATVRSTILSDSAFGSDIYTGLNGQCCLEVYCYSPSVTLVIDNINLIHPNDNIYYKYSIILGSVQFNEHAPANYEVTQEFITNGAPWQQIAWGGSATSPVVEYYDFNRRVVITTTHAISGSPVLISDPPTSIEINLTGTPDLVTGYYVSRFTISTVIKEIPIPTRGINLFKFQK